MITADDVKETLKEINQTYFANELDLTYVFVSFPKMRGKLANFLARNKEWQALQINPVFKDLPMDELYETLVHELVHCWQYQTGKSLDHGLSFRNKGKQILGIDPNMDIGRTGGSDKVLDLLGYDPEPS